MDTGQVLVAEGISKRFGKRTVLSDAGLEVRAGEIVALVGEWSGQDHAASDLRRAASRR